MYYLESEIRAKLEANIPRAKLTIDAENGDVVIAGTVPGNEYSTIEPLAKIMKDDRLNIEQVKIIPYTNLS